MAEADARTRAKYDEMLARANSLRLKGDLKAALAACREALTLWAEGAEAWEMLGDLLLSQMQVEEALSAYGRARQLAPSEARIEEKYAVALLSRADQQELPLLEERLSRQGQDKERAKALRLAILLPGAGHYYLGEKTIGLVLFGAAVLAVMALWSALAMIVYPTPQVAMRGTITESLIAIVAASVYLGLLVYSVLDVWRLCRVYFPIKSPWDVKPPAPAAGGEPTAEPPSAPDSGPGTSQ